MSDERFEYLHPVAVCTLADDALGDRLRARPECEGLLIAPLRTENLGIEQIIQFCVERPTLRYVALCGADARQCVGHLPGASFLALMAHGLDDSGRILHAPGKRPVLTNVSPQAVAHFRSTVTLIDHVDCDDEERIIQSIVRCLRENPGPSAPFVEWASVEATTPAVIDADAEFSATPFRCDPSGYCVIDLVSGRIRLRHYEATGRHALTLQGVNARSLYRAATAHHVASRLDHAAYLGYELARAESALHRGETFAQDANAPLYATPDAVRDVAPIPV